MSMAPTLDDECNAAWAEVRKARAENKRLREHLQALLRHVHGYHRAAAPFGDCRMCDELTTAFLEKDRPDA